MRAAEVVDAWQDNGQDHVTVRFAAHLVDYTTDERTAEVVAGSASQPVPFEESWTFTRPIWAKTWRLSETRRAVLASS
jgi:predicted lipid-binding transport protein (Tim44 family)